MSRAKTQVYTKYIQNKMHKTMFANIYFSNFSSFIFKSNHAFIVKEDNPSEKVVIDKEELYGIDIDGIGNLEDFPRTVFIN